MSLDILLPILLGYTVLDVPRGSDFNQYEYGGEFAPFGRIRLHVFVIGSPSPARQSYLIILCKNDQIKARDDQIEARRRFAGDWQESGVFCRVVEDADPYGGKAEAVAFAGNPRGGSPLSRFNEGFPKGGENEIFPLWRFFASFLIVQKGCPRREPEHSIFSIANFFPAQNQPVSFDHAKETG